MRKNSEEGITIGDRFLCFKTVAFNKGANDLIFKYGKIYDSQHTGCITDEGGNAWHSFTYPYWSQCLVKLKEDGSVDLKQIKDLPLGEKIRLAKLIKKYSNG